MVTGCQRTFKLSTLVHRSDDDTNTVRTEWPECFESSPVVEVGSGSDVEVIKVCIDWAKL